MQLKQNAIVKNMQGDKLAHIERVVIDPRDKQVTHLVAEKGLFFKTAKVIPIDMVDKANKEEVVLMQSVDDLDSLPDFETEHHIPARVQDAKNEISEQQVETLYWYSPTPTRSWWGERAGFAQYPNFLKPPYVVTTERNIPEGTVPLKEGAKIFSSDGNLMGNLEKVYTQAPENRAAYLLLSKGSFAEEKKLIPTAWISTILEDKIHLSVKTAIISNLPEFKNSN
jgi:uncharacterized protein YrrD